MYLDCALDYLGRGYSIIPAGRNKKPAIATWKEYQGRLPREEEVLQWFQGQGVNIAIVAGKLSGIVVVDVDGEIGLETVKKLNLPKGPTVKTGKGWHRYFQYPINGDVRNFQKKEGLPGIDLRAEGGFVIAPPSIHESGQRYQWVIPLDGKPLPPLPESILAVAPADRTPVAKLLKGIPEGQRNNSLTSIAGHLFAKGWDCSNVLQFCLTWNTYNKPPLSEREVEGTVESIYKTHLRNRPENQDGESDKRGEPIRLISAQDILELEEDLSWAVEG